MTAPTDRSKRQRALLQLRETRARLRRYEDTVARQNRQIEQLRRNEAFRSGMAIFSRSSVPDAFRRGEEVLVAYHLRHRYAGSWSANYCPAQRVRASWEGPCRYIASGVVRVDVYNPVTGQVTPRDVHLVEDPSGAMRHVLLEDMRLAEPAREARR
ncbi:MAG TPA: hypothetical protein PKD55_18720 [Bellilinea sp.]|nr:hypothetical protein [Bellilinea sp.]